MSATEALEGGFVDPARDAANVFRSVLRAMARPGTINPCSGASALAPISEAAACVIATLCDPDTPLFLAGACDTPAMRNWVAFQTGAPLVGPEQCRFALGAWDHLQPLDRFATGVPDYPDRSATLIVEMAALHQAGATLSGPGIKETAQLSLPETDAFQRNARAFPLALDFIFTAGAKVAALPRTTRVT